MMLPRNRYPEIYVASLSRRFTLLILCFHFSSRIPSDSSEQQIPPVSLRSRVGMTKGCSFSAR
jgi:hypothetical protein